jgi:hypothetical protein
MPDVIQGPKSDAQRVQDRLKPSAGTPDTATTQTTTGTGPTRVVHTIHRGSTQRQHGTVDHGSPGIAGERRTFLGDNR